MNKRKGPMTAKELMDKLQAKSEFRLREESRKARRLRIEEACNRLEKPMLNELREHGYVGDSINDLVNNYAPLPQDIVEVLLRWIEKTTGKFIEDMSIEDRVVEMWVRALAATQEQFDGRVLIRSFERTNSESLKWAVANAVALTRPHSIDKWLNEKLEDPYWGKTLRDLGFK